MNKYMPYKNPSSMANLKSKKQASVFHIFAIIFYYVYQITKTVCTLFSLHFFSLLIKLISCVVKKKMSFWLANLSKLPWII